MALFRERRRKQQPEPVPEPDIHLNPDSLVASAARITKMDGLGWRQYRFGDESWQQELWRLYDLIGEFHFLANWIGSACSRVRIYVADVDENGRIQQECTDKKISGLADTLFGGPTEKSEALRMLAINLTVAGAAYIIGRSTDDPDRDSWMVVSCSELRRWGERVWILWPDGEKEDLDPSRDIIIRVWTPHPRRNLWADCPARAAMSMLWEIERLTRYSFAQIDSRLVSAGMVAIPKETSFPDEDPEMSGAEALTEKLVRLGSLSLQGEGSAAGVVPIFVEMPMDALGKIQLIEFASQLSKQAPDQRAEAIRRFALAMDVDPSILSGAGEANHWGAWQIMEGQIKIHIEPLMTRICDALTQAYLHPAIKALGYNSKKPERYAYWFDTAPLTVRPQRLEDTLNLYEKDLVSAETVLIEGDYKLTDAPSDDESARRFIRELLLRDSNLFQIPAVRKAAGIPEALLPANTVFPPPQGAGPPPPPAPPTGIQSTGPGPIPENSVAQNALPGPGGEAGVPAGVPTGIAASASTPLPSQLTLFAIANAAVIRALEVAGKRSIGNFKRHDYSVQAHEVHTVRRADEVERLLRGAWEHLDVLVTSMELPDVDITKLADTLNHYCIQLLERGISHRAELLAGAMKVKGFLYAEP